jgi:hypothetical protein
MRVYTLHVISISYLKNRIYAKVNPSNLDYSNISRNYVYPLLLF